MNTEDAVYSVYDKDGILKRTTNFDVRFPFVDMSEGDYFDVPLYMSHDVKKSSTYFGKRHGKIFRFEKFKEELILRCFLDGDVAENETPV